MNDPLTQLADKYGADKSPNIKHGYTPFYWELLKDRRDQIKKVLEIGAGEGASLRMWRDFFPNAQIYAGDNEDNRLFKANRIEVFKCDQSKPEKMSNLILSVGQDCDIIIDDGSHKAKDQLQTVFVLMPLLSNNGVYIIEDVDDSEADELFRHLNLHWNCEMHKFGKRRDDRVIVVRHKNG